MGYTIEISFSIIKQSSIDEAQNIIIDLARDHYCNFYYVDFEMENEYNTKRNHCVITVNFENSNLNDMTDFLKKLKHLYNKNDYYIETIYNDETNKYIYASKYYLIRNTTNKSLTKEYFINKKSKKYSDEEKSILKAIGKSL